MLTERKIQAVKQQEKPYKLFDVGGLYLLIKPNGSKLWQQKMRFGGKENVLSHGSYPQISLKRAREKRDEARSQLADKVNPAAERRMARDAIRRARENDFQSVAQEWFQHYQTKRARENKPLSAATVEKSQWLLNLAEYRGTGRQRGTHPLRAIASMPVSQITKAEIRAVIGGLVTRGKVETAHRMLDRLSRVFRFAVGTGRMQVNPAAAYRDSDDPRDELPSLRVRHHAAITEPRKVGELLRAIYGYSGQPSTESALKLAPLVFVRPGELRAADWGEFDLAGNEPTWRIPAARMKMRREHVVPLAAQAVAILKDQRRISGPDGMVFPSLTDPRRAMSENTLTAALRRMGYAGDQMTWHGFRTIASTLLNELNWSPELIEMQLAHRENDGTRAAYNRSEKLPERRKMMQQWADYLDGLRSGSNVVPIRRKR